MKKLLTKDDVSKLQFFQLPKDFFSNPTYVSMRLESKVAYSMLLDLLPLSIKNNWANDKGQVFVKLSRKKLMAMLGIKGSQKIAQVMKELVDHKLIVNKRIGLTKCNEIYLYPLDGQSLKKHEPKTKIKPLETKPVKTKIQEASSPVNTTATIEEVQDLLDNQIHIEDLKEKYDPDFVDEIGNNICEMFLNTSTRIGQQDKPSSIMRGVIRKLKMYHIEHVIDQFMAVAAESEIFNPKRYIQTMIYNSIYEASTKVAAHIRYHFGYC